LSADASRSDRFLDPPEIDNFHNHGGLAHVFGRFGLLATHNDLLRLSLSTNGTDFQGPNLAEQQDESQLQRQEFPGDYETLVWTHVFSSEPLSEVTLSRRSSSARLRDPDQTGTPFFLTQNRRTRTEGLRASFSTVWKNHSIKAGVEGSS